MVDEALPLAAPPQLTLDVTLAARLKLPAWVMVTEAVTEHPLLSFIVTV